MLGIKLPKLSEMVKPKPIALSQIETKKPTPIAEIDPRLSGLTDYMRGERDKDIAGGMDFGTKYFGGDNPEMKAVLDARKATAFGDDGQTALAREAGMEGINRQVQTALRQFQGRLPGTGVRGGAAGAMAGILTRDAIGQTRGLERDLAINEMQRRREALGDYEHTITGERAGLLGSAFGFAGLGSQDRYGGLGYLSSRDFLEAARQGVRDNPGPGSDPGNGSQIPINPVTGLPAYRSAADQTGTGGYTKAKAKQYKPYDPRGWDVTMSSGGGGGGGGGYTGYGI